MRLIWDETLGLGYYPVDPTDTPYDAAYFDKYRGYADTELGEKINTHRVDLVERFAPDRRVLDVGIGCGQFVETMRQRGRSVYGYDVNPEGAAWLWQRYLFRQPTREICVMTFWDSFEHIPCPDRVVKYATDFVFMSIPIFIGCDHAKSSKHFRPDEHYWYFTARGLSDFMADEGFRLVHMDREESRLGREDIASFVFKRS